MEKNSIIYPTELVVIGGSAGSLDVLLHILPTLVQPLNFAMVIVLHRNTTQPFLLESLFASKTTILVKEAEEKEMIVQGNIYIAPPDYHLLIEKDHTFSLDFSEKIWYCRPSIDVTFETAAEAYGKQLTGILLSGANADGVDGLKAIKQFGGTTIVQDPATAVVAYMPQQAIDSSMADYIMDDQKIGIFINQLNKNG